MFFFSLCVLAVLFGDKMRILSIVAIYELYILKILCYLMKDAERGEFVLSVLKWVRELGVAVPFYYFYLVYNIIATFIW